MKINTKSHVVDQVLGGVSDGGGDTCLGVVAAGFGTVYAHLAPGFSGHTDLGQTHRGAAAVQR